MTWEDITVEHYQTIYPYIKDESLTDVERDVKILTILTGKSEVEIDRMPWVDFLKLQESVSFLHEETVPVKPVEVLKANGKTYRIMYDIRRMPVARYAEVKHFAGDERQLIMNLHLIMASMVVPCTRRWHGRFVECTYEPDKHEQYAQDILEAKFSDVFYSMVFFCNLFANWTRSSLDSLVKRMTRAGMEEQKARRSVLDLCAVMDGYIMSNKLPTISTSRSTKRGR